VLSGDGADLAAALRTIYEVGDREALAETIDRAFPGSSVEVVDIAGRFQLLLHQPGLNRPLSVAELSDGTLRYLLLTAALLTPRPPELLVLNEPESSLHPDLLAPLAALIADAAERSQTYRRVACSTVGRRGSRCGRSRRCRRLSDPTGQETTLVRLLSMVKACWTAQPGTGRSGRSGSARLFWQ